MKVNTESYCTTVDIHRVHSTYDRKTLFMTIKGTFLTRIIFRIMCYYKFSNINVYYTILNNDVVEISYWKAIIGKISFTNYFFYSKLVKLNFNKKSPATLFTHIY